MAKERKGVGSSVIGHNRSVHSETSKLSVYSKANSGLSVRKVNKIKR